MKRIIFTSFFIVSAIAAVAQSKLDLQSRWQLKNMKNGIQATTPLSSRKKVTSTFMEEPSRVMSFIRLNSTDAKVRLEEAGVRILRTRGNIALTTIPLDSVEKVARMDCVSRVQLARKVQPMMYNSRKAVGVDKIHEGIDLPQAYTGKGVVCGIVDNGIDPNHINFLTPEGKTRFGYMSHIYSSTSTSDGYIYENYYPREQLSESEAKYTYAIEDFKTDDKTDYHGTHTLGTMVGGYKGKVMASVVDDADPTKATIEEIDNPYYGCATDAELVASTGDYDYYDMFLAYGIDDCINYALYSNGVTTDGYPIKPKPCVINLSIGRILGPHDKNGLMNQYLDAAGQDAIVCMSAGNSADYPICANKTFEDKDTVMQTFIRPMTEGLFPDPDYTDLYNMRSGEILVYSSDSREFEIQAVIYNQKRGNIALRIPVASNTDGTYTLYASDSDFAGGSSYIENATFKKAFNGYVAVATMLDEDTQRYYAHVVFFTYDNTSANADGNYILGLVVKGHDGQRIDAYGDGYYTYFDGYNKNGWQNGTADGTINEMAVADNVISVGSYNNCSYLGYMDGTTENLGEELPLGEATVFSSYATMPDGTTLPTVCAPGTGVISSANNYYAEKLTSLSWTATADVNGRTNYWLASSGTSMSTPLVAGSIALWLEADPTLTTSDVKDIIFSTAVRDEFVEEGIPAQWGAGKFDAYAGLKEVLRRRETKIDEIAQEENSKLVLSPAGGNSFHAFIAGADRMNASVYNANGVKVFQQTANGDELTVNLGALSRGIYILRVNNVSQKIIL